MNGREEAAKQELHHLTAYLIRIRPFSEQEVESIGAKAGCGEGKSESRPGRGWAVGCGFQGPCLEKNCLLEQVTAIKRYVNTAGMVSMSLGNLDSLLLVHFIRKSGSGSHQSTFSAASALWSFFPC